MCGIVYLHNYKAESAVKSVLKRYEDQKSRGTQGFGLVGFSLEDFKIGKYIREAGEKEIRKEMETLEKSNAILFHHRTPTSTPNLAECAHPIEVNNTELEYQYYVVHNGVISNDDDLKPIHEALGYAYTTEITEKRIIETRGMIYPYEDVMKFNDSESLAIELARHIEGKSKTVDAKGTIAFIVLQVKDGLAQRLYFGRNYGNPLNVLIESDLLCISSEGKGDTVKTDKLYCYHYATKEITESELELKTNYLSSGYRGMGFDPERRNLPATKEAETWETSQPALMAKEYLEGYSCVDCTIDEYIENGMSLEEIEEETYEESYALDDLIEYEKPIINSVWIKRLEAQKVLIDQRIGLLNSMLSLQNSLTD